MKKRLSILVALLGLISAVTQAQKENTLIRSGNRYYKEKKFDQSQAQYQKAIQESPDNPAAHYNLGNAEFRKNSFDDAVNSYNASIEHSTTPANKEKGLYNKGVALIKQQKLDESIDAWKNALEIDPADSLARENLQKALLEKKQQAKQQEKKKDRQKKQDQKKEEQPQPQQSRLSKQQVEQLLNALTQREKEVQDKLNQNKTRALTQPDKDW